VNSPDDLAQRIRERVSLDDLAAMCRAVIATPSANSKQRARAARELHEIDALRMHGTEC
jgi:hypothetical protein